MDMMTKLAGLEDLYTELLTKAQEVVEDDKRLNLETDRCNSYYEVLHTMGRNTSYHYYAQHQETYEIFTDAPDTKAELLCDGVYADRDKIYQQFLCFHHYNNFPGTCHMHPVSSPFIQVAGDGATAKVYMYTCGLEALPSPPGQAPLSMWFYDAYGNWLVKEGKEWKFCVYHAMDDIKATYFQSWSEMDKAGPHPSAAGLMPPFSYKAPEHHDPYGLHRKPTLAGSCVPEPYETMPHPLDF